MMQWLARILKYGSPLGLIVLPALILYGTLSPWPIAKVALGQHPGTKAILVGFSYESKSVGGRDYERRSQTYALFPTSLKTLSTFRVTQEDSTVRAEEVQLGLLATVLIYLACAIATWWFWVYSPRLAHARGRP